MEGLEFGKSDFVLLDEVTMDQFMENLKLRYVLVAARKRKLLM